MAGHHHDPIKGSVGMTEGKGKGGQRLEVKVKEEHQNSGGRDKKGLYKKPAAWPCWWVPKAEQNWTVLG